MSRPAIAGLAERATGSFGPPKPIHRNPPLADQFFAASAGAKTGPGQDLLPTLFHGCSSRDAIILQLAVF